MIITSQALYERLENETLTILDVRPIEDYQNQHIPNAVHFAADQASMSKPPVNGLLPDLKAFESYASNKGISNSTTVIVYDQQGNPSSGRVAWTLLALGHPDVLILDGGFDAWLEDEHPISNIETETDVGTFKVTRQESYIADQAYILSRLTSNETAILDVRTADEYNGIDIRSKHGGHIPGAIHMNWVDTKDPSAKPRFKELPALKKAFEQLGLNQDQEIIVYCQSHQRSALVWLLLKTLGYTNVKGYPGAWSDWGNADDTPVEK